MWRGMGKRTDCVEGSFDTLSNRTHNRDFAVLERVNRIAIVVEVLDVAPADNCNPSVDQEYLIAHSTVQRFKTAGGTGDEPECRNLPAAVDGVEELDFAIGVRCRGPRELIRIACREKLISKQPHPDAPPGCSDQLAKPQLANVVVGPNIGLNIDRVYCGPDQMKTAQQGAVTFQEANETPVCAPQQRSFRTNDHAR